MQKSCVMCSQNDPWLCYPWIIFPSCCESTCTICYLLTVAGCNSQDVCQEENYPDTVRLRMFQRPHRHNKSLLLKLRSMIKIHTLFFIFAKLFQLSVTASSFPDETLLKTDINETFTCFLYPTKLLNCSWSFHNLPEDTQLSVCIRYTCFL